LAKSAKKKSGATPRKSRPLSSRALEKESEQVLDEEIDGKEEFEKENL